MGAMDDLRHWVLQNKLKAVCEPGCPLLPPPPPLLVPPPPLCTLLSALPAALQHSWVCQRPTLIEWCICSRILGRELVCDPRLPVDKAYSNTAEAHSLPGYSTGSQAQKKAQSGVSR